MILLCLFSFPAFATTLSGYICTCQHRNECTCSNGEKVIIELSYASSSNDGALTGWSDGFEGDEEDEDDKGENGVSTLDNILITTSSPSSFNIDLLAQGFGLASMINHAKQGLWGTLLPDQDFEYFSNHYGRVVKVSTKILDCTGDLDVEDGIVVSYFHGVTSYKAYHGSKLVITIKINTLGELVGISFEDLHIIINQTVKTKELASSGFKGDFKVDAATPLLFINNIIRDKIFDPTVIKYRHKHKYTDTVNKLFELSYLEIILFLILGSEHTKKIR